MISRSAFVAGLAAVPASLTPVRAQTPGMPLTVSVSDISASKVPYIVAAESGIYARNGLDVTQFITPLAAEIARGNGVTVPPENIRSGIEPEISTGGGSPVVVMETTIATVPPRVILATTDTNGAFFRLYARPSIKRIPDLKGKRIGYIIRGSVDDLLLNALARRMGWDPAKDWSMFSGVAGAQVAAKTNMDAFVSDPLAAPEALRLGYGDLGDLLRFKFAVLGSSVSALRSWLPAHRPTAAAFVKSMVEAIALVKRDKGAAIAAMETWFGLTDAGRQESFYAWAARIPAKPYPSEPGLRLVRELYTWREMEAHPVSYFIDPSFMRVLDRSGAIDALYKR